MKDARFERGWCWVVRCAGIGIFSCVLAQAQSTTATISGTVTDATGAVIAGATVRASNQETGINRGTVTDSSGRYSLPQLGLGLFSVEATMAGFQTEVRSGIRLTVGREAVVDLRLNVGAVTERVEVTGEAPLVQTKDSAVSFLVDENTMRDLPLNGRSYTQLATLQPNVIPNTNYSKHMSAGTGLNLVVQGQRPGANLFLMDGTEANDYVGKTPGGMIGATLGVEAIREFNLLTGNFSAEYGHYMGGVVNVVTRSGTNAFHGNVFHFLRNSALDAKNFFDSGRAPIPPFKRNNFGATFGGPIAKDRAFFFANYEGLRERKSLTAVWRVPDEPAHRGILPSGPVPVSASVRPLLDVLPLPNGSPPRLFGDGTGEYIGNPFFSGGANYGVIRTDLQISDAHSLFARYTVDDSHSAQPEPVPIFESLQEGRNQFLTVSETAILSPTTLNVLSAGFNRTGGLFHSEDLVSFPAGYTYLAGVNKVAGFLVRSPALAYGNGGGTRQEDPRYWYLSVYELNDKISRQMGAHALKMGATVKRYDFVGFSTGPNYLGRPTFDNLTEFLQGRPITFAAAPQFRDVQRAVGSHLFGAFLQDDIQLRSNLTLNLGLRYEFSTSPVEKNGKMASLPNPDTDTTLTIPGEVYVTTKKNFSPRFGFAWDPFSNGKTSVRGGASVFYNILTPTNLELVITMASQAPYFQSVTLSRTATSGDIAFPRGFDTPIGNTVRDITASSFDPVANAPTRYFWTLGIQHELVANTVTSVTYSGSRASHLIFTGNRNGAIPRLDANGQPFFPTGLLPRNPAWGTVNWREYGGNGYYHALAANVVRRFSRGVQGQVAYTWSKNLDDGSVLFSNAEATNNSGGVQDFYNRRADKGSSNFDIRQNFVANVTWDLPLGTHAGVAAKLIEGWQVSGIITRSSGLSYTAKSGFPVSRSFPPVSSVGADRPNVLPGADSNRTSGTTSGCGGGIIPAGQRLGTPDRYFDPCVFELQPAGYFGNAGRGTIVGPGFFNLDFSVKKNTQIREGTRLEFRAEFFNILNHPNFGTVNTNVFVASRLPQGAAGRISDTRNESRQIQFGIKLNF